MFNVGDIVRIIPYSDIEDHFCIPEDYWKECSKKDRVITVLKGDTAMLTDIYGYLWPLEALIPIKKVQIIKISRRKHARINTNLK